MLHQAVNDLDTPARWFSSKGTAWQIQLGQCDQALQQACRVNTFQPSVKFLSLDFWGRRFVVLNRAVIFSIARTYYQRDRPRISSCDIAI